MLVLDSGGVSFLAARTRRAAALIEEYRSLDLWPPLIPSTVLIECLRGSGADATTNRFLKTCLIEEGLPTSLARRAAELRHRAGTGSAVDALVAASAEPGGVVLSSDADDLPALAAAARAVSVHLI